jgi:hypothetical protein
MTSPDVPDAVAAVVAAVLEDHPYAPPRRQAELIVGELRRLGFRVVVPMGRATTEAVEPQEALSGSRSCSRAHHPARSVNGR